MVGGTKVPWRHSPLSSSWSTRRPAVRMASMWRTMPLRASASITGPTSTDRRSGLPTLSSRMAPRSIVSTWSALSSWMHSTRSAEQRWPAESKAELSTSNTTCSASADESTTIAFWRRSRRSAEWCGRRRPGDRQRAGDDARHVGRAGEHDAAHARAGPPAARRRSRHGRAAVARRHGTPAARRISMAWAAISGVCSAGLASTVLPAASAAATWPVKMAREVPGLMHSTVPSGRCVSLPNSRDA